MQIDDRGGNGTRSRNNQNSRNINRISPGLRRRRQIMARRSNDQESYIGRGTQYLRTFNQIRSQA